MLTKLGQGWLTLHPILQKLTGGDRRSIGCAEAVVADVIVNPALFSVVIKAMTDGDPVVCMRAADVVEKVTRLRPKFLKPHKSLVLRLFSEADQQEVRWHLAQIVPRLTLTRSQRIAVVDILKCDLTHNSRIVCVNAMQGLADLALKDRKLRLHVIALIETRIRTGSAAIRARARRLHVTLSAAIER